MTERRIFMQILRNEALCHQFAKRITCLTKLSFLETHVSNRKYKIIILLMDTLIFSLIKIFLLLKKVSVWLFVYNLTYSYARKLIFLSIGAKCTLLVTTKSKSSASLRIFKNPSNSCIILRRLQGKSMLVPQIMIARFNPIPRLLVLSEIFLQLASCRFVTKQDASAYKAGIHVAKYRPPR